MRLERGMVFMLKRTRQYLQFFKKAFMFAFLISQPQLFPLFLLGFVLESQPPGDGYSVGLFKILIPVSTVIPDPYDMI